MPNLTEQAFIKIRELISNGELYPGERLVESRICELLALGRTPIREALRRLESEGYVDILPNKGAVIKKISLIELKETYELIALLESRAVEISTNYLQETHKNDLYVIQDVLTQAANEKDKKTWVEKNAQFHTYFLDISQNNTLSKITNQLRRSGSRYRSITAIVPGPLTQYVKAHNDILNAAFNGDAKKAGRIMHEHVIYAMEKLIEFLGQMLTL